MSIFISSGSTDKQSLMKTIVKTVKGYIYVPEQGELVFNRAFSTCGRYKIYDVMNVCHPVFRFPLKLAVSAFIAFVAIYHVSLKTMNINKCTHLCILSTLYPLVLFTTDGHVVGRSGDPHSPHRPCWY